MKSALNHFGPFEKKFMLLIISMGNCLIVPINVKTYTRKTFACWTMQKSNKNIFFYPDVSNYIKNVIANCKVCLK